MQGSALCQWSLMTYSHNNTWMDEMSRVSKKNQVIVKYMRYNFIFKNSKNTQNQTHVWDKAMYGKSIKFKKVSISERRGRHMSAVHGRSKDVGNVPFLNLVIGGGLQMLTLHCTYMLHISFGINNIFANFLMKSPCIIIRQIIVETRGWRLFDILLHFFLFWVRKMNKFFFSSF